MINDSQIQKIARTVLTATAEAEAGRVTYLRTLIEAAQDQIGNKKGLEPREQIAALTAVHERFYEVVVGVVSELVPRALKGRATELHRRANFARTAVSSVRRYLRAGNDLASIKADKATKRSLMVQLPQKPATARRLKGRAETQSKALVATIIGLADTDKAAAVEEIQLVLGQLANQLVALGVAATKDAALSFAEHRPLRIGKTLFVPTETQVIAQEARPS